MKRFPSFSLVFALAPAFLSLPAAPASARDRDLDRLAILGPDYPRAFFFRGSEGGPARPTPQPYEDWKAEFDRLMGIMGKCLDEEVIGRERNNPEYFSRFKADHPEQVVLLHFNGNARDPRYRTEKYFPGHWIYRQATIIAADVPAEAGETVIQVENASDFRTGIGRYRTSNDDIALFGIAPDGKHDWNRCEQVQLVAVDRKANTITVRRGCYGTEPLAFAAGKARAAAHQVEGPWGRHNHLMWFYNFTTHCPRDAEGKTCADRLVDDLAGWFGKGGKLEAFDGMEFDVMFHQTHGDTDGDGEIDNGVIDGINRYGIGVVEFARQLRERMGDDFIIQADGALGPGGIRSQRAWGILNGIESEGFPNLRDWDMEDWSGGLNRHAFWQVNARPPVFHYINHKWIDPVPGQPGVHRNPEGLPYARHRLAMAAAQFTDAMICYSFAPPRDPGGKFGIWDELRCGAENRIAWLGKPEGPPVRLAARSPDLLGVLGAGSAKKLAARIRGAVRAEPAPGGGVTVTPADPQAAETVFSLRDAPADGSDLTVFATLRAEPRRHYPPEMARFATVEIAGGQMPLMNPAPDNIGMGIRGQPERELDRETGARVQYVGAHTIGGVALPAYAVHPPYRNKGETGYVFWTADLDVPDDAELRFSLGMGELSPERSDGVWFRICVADLAGGPPGEFEKIFEKSSKEHRWLPQTVSLADYAGRRVRLKFVSDCGPRDNSTTDQGAWGNIRVMKRGASDDEVTPPASLMTWVNDRDFASAFYFREVRSGKLDLTFTVEGPEPVTLRSVTAHAAPDAIYRLFENGIVLANPSHGPVTFRLAEIAPDRSHRRFQATKTQDTKTNNGKPVGDEIALEAMDALFLVRVR